MGLKPKLRDHKHCSGPLRCYKYNVQHPLLLRYKTPNVSCTDAFFNFLAGMEKARHRWKSELEEIQFISSWHLFHRIQTIGFGSFSLKNFKLFGNSTYQHFDSFSSPTQWSSGFNVMLGNFPFQTYTLNKNLMCSYSLHLFTQHL